MDSFLNLAAHGFDAKDFALSLMRVLFGLFFFLSGSNKLVDPGRHAAMVKTLWKDKVPMVKFMQWWVPFWEFTGGMMLMLGLFTSFNASVLLIICAVACKCEAKARVDAYKPINPMDRVDDYLYLPEMIYLFGLLAIAVSGGGDYGLDSVFF